jgi:tetratricopeptide (TPR) repeat protein/uncharacterized caspase-like protein
MLKKLNSIKKALAAVLCLAFLLANQGHCQDSATDDYASRVEAARTSKDLAGLAHLLTSQAMIYQKAGAFAQAEPLLSEAYQISRRVLKESDSASLAALERLADCYYMLNKMADAEPLYLRAIDLRQKEAGHEEALLRDLNTLAALYRKSGKADEADKISARTVSFVEERYKGAEPARLVDILLARARFQTDASSFEQAQATLEKALKICQNSQSENMSMRHARVLTGLANVYLEADNYKAAERCLNEALAIDEKSERQSLRVAVDLTALGQLYLRQGKYDQSEKVYKEALQTVQKLKGNDDLEAASCLNNLALLYRNTGDLSKAETLLKEGLAIRAKANPQSLLVAQSLVNLADIVAANDRAGEAQPLLEQALAIEEKQVGVNHDYVALILRELIEILKEQKGKLAIAEKYSKRLLERDLTVFSGESLVIARDLETLGKILISENKIAEAKTVIARARSIEKMQKSIEFEEESPDQAKPSEPGPIADKWALVVGISNFHNADLNLRFAAKDAIDFKNFLINHANFKPDHVKLLIDQDATRTNIVAALGDKWMKRVVKPEDLAVIYISSHGTQAANHAGGTNFIVPYEADAHNIVFSGIPMQWLVAGLKELLPSERICVFLDVCHGGAAAADPDKSLSTGKSQSDVTESGKVGMKALVRIRDLSAKTLACSPGQVVVAASQADQISWESMRYSNGVFTRRLIEGLSRSGDDTQLYDAFNYLRDQVEEEVLRDRTQLQAPVVVPKASTIANLNLKLGVKPHNPRSVEKLP